MDKCGQKRTKSAPKIAPDFSGVFYLLFASSHYAEPLRNLYPEKACVFLVGLLHYNTYLRPHSEIVRISILWTIRAHVTRAMILYKKHYHTYALWISQKSNIKKIDSLQDAMRYNPGT